MIDYRTKEVIKKIARVQKEALNYLLFNKDSIFEDDLCALLGLGKEDLTQEAVDAIDTLIRIYSDIEESPGLIKLLSEYQLGVCSHILFKMEDQWLVENPIGVCGAWDLIHEAVSKFHPEYKLIL